MSRILPCLCPETKFKRINNLIGLAPLMPPTMTSPPSSSSSSWRKRSTNLRCMAILTAAALYCSSSRHGRIIPPIIPSVEARTSSSSSSVAAAARSHHRCFDDHRQSLLSNSEEDNEMFRARHGRVGLGGVVFARRASSFVPRRSRSSFDISFTGMRNGSENENSVECSISAADLVTVISRGGGGGSDSDVDVDDDESQDDEGGEEENDDDAEVGVEGEESSDDEKDYSEEADEEDDEDVEGEYESDEDDDEEEVAVVEAKGKSSPPKSSSSSSVLKSSILSKTRDGGEGPIPYDDLLTPPAMQQLFVSVGVMMLSKRIDITNEKAVRIARYAFLAYLVSVQAFLLYVTLRAKTTNDRTPVKITSPFASLLPSNLAGGGGNFMVKAIADQILSTQTTVLEYDLKMAWKMNSGLLFPMLFLYFLHFKMRQVQPLLMQTATGFVNLAYSPLFQVYVLGRNLERPFRPPAATNPMMDALKQQLEGNASGGDENGDANGGDVRDVNDEDEDEDEEEEERDSEEEDGEDEEGDDASDAEDDSDEDEDS